MLFSPVCFNLLYQVCLKSSVLGINIACMSSRTLLHHALLSIIQMFDDTTAKPTIAIVLHKCGMTWWQLPANFPSRT